MNAVLLALVCGFAACVFHLMVGYFGRRRMDNEPVIFELRWQVKLILIIYSFTFLIYAVFFFYMLPENSIYRNGLSVHYVVWLVYGAVLYFLLAFIYLTFYYLVDRSISATILEFIDSSEQKKLDIDEILGLYDINKKYDNELKSMVEGRFIAQDSGYYKNTLKGSMYAIIARAIKSILKLGPGG